MGKSSSAGKQGWARLFPQNNKSIQGSSAPQVPSVAAQSSSAGTSDGSKGNQKSKPSWLQPKPSKPAPVPSSTPAAQPSLTTEKSDYDRGELVRITASGVTRGAMVRFSMADDPNQPGLDGNADNYGSFLVRDGGPGDLDPRKGVVATNWRVPMDDNGTGTGTPDALGARVLITAQEMQNGKDCKWDSADDVVKGPPLSTTITDAIIPLTNAPLSLVGGIGVTLDETRGLQNKTATPDPSGDADDNDIDIDISGNPGVPDFPLAFKTRLIALNADPLTSDGAALSGYDGSNSGLDIFTRSGASFDIAFTDASGNLLNGVNSGLRTRISYAEPIGYPIYLYTDSVPGGNNNIVLGRAGTASGLADPNGKITFAAYIEETSTGGKIWTIQYTPLQHKIGGDPDDQLSLANMLYIGSVGGKIDFSFANAPSGQNLFLMLGDPSGAGIVITCKKPANQSSGVNINTGDTVNTSQGGGFTTIGVNNQMIDPATASKPLEGLYVTFVTNPVTNYTIPNLDPNEADVEGNIQFGEILNTTSAGFTISQTQPAEKASTIRLSAWFTADGVTADKSGGATIERSGTFIDPSGGYTDDFGRQITEVTIRDSSGGLLFTANRSGGATQTSNGLTVTFDDLGVTLSGLKSKYSVLYSTADLHNRVLIENAGKGNANNASFDVGAFRLSQGVTVTPLEIGSKLRFEDDGPINRLDASGGSPELKVDDTNLALDASGSFASQFVTIPDYGVDGSGASSSISTYALGVKSAGVDSGLVDVATGNPVYLFLQNGEVVGRARALADPSGAPDPSGIEVFNVSVDSSGIVTLDQIRPLRHPVTTNPNDSVTFAAADLISLTRTDRIFDWDGDFSDASGTIFIARDMVFGDDVPSAVNDGPFGVKEDAAPNVVSGNVTGNDRSGADAPLEFVSWDGATGDDLSAYGTLVQNPTTGAWSFTLDNSLAATQALTATDVKTAVYSYTIKDADGDVDTATLTVTVTGANDGATVETPNAEGADSTVYEAGLPTGSDVQPSDRDVASNSFTVSATDGIATVVIGGMLFTLAQLQALNGTQTVNTGEGVLTLNSYSGDSFSGTVNYTYALSATIDNDSKPGASGTEFNDSVEITVNGVGGTTASDQLVIEIIDDVPSAVNDGPFGVKEDAAPNVVSGNVTGNDRSGADAPLEFVSWDGATGDDLSAYGTLVQNPTTGAWSFTLDNSLAATQALTATDVKTAVYSYTIKDADGDVDTATLTVTVTGANDGATVETPNAEGADSTVYEAGLPTGSDVQPSDRDVASNSFTVSATDGIATVVIGGTLFTLAQLQALNGTQTVNTGEGVLTLNSYSGDSFSGTVNYTYALSATIDNDSKPGASGTEFNDSVEITVNGVGGTTASDQLVIEIIDDVPSAVNDGPFGVKEDAAPNVVSGNVTGNDRSGADAPLEFVSWDGATGDDLSAYGTLVQNPTTGAWSFTLDNSLAATQALTATDVKTAVYSYTIKDADGDVDTATLTVRVTGANDGATVETPNAEGADSTVYEAGLPTGSDVQPSDRDVASNSFTVSATDGIATVVIGGTLFTLAQLQAFNGTQTVNTGEGVLTLNSYSGDSFSGTVNYTYALSATIDNDSKPGASGTEFNDSVEITVNGVGGTTASDQLVIKIIDDVPSAVNDGPFGVKEDAAPNVVSGNVTGNDRSGADAPLEFVSWDGATGDDLSAYGTLVQNPTTGAWSFTLDNSLAATQALTATDVKTAVYSYTIKDADGDVDTATLTVTVTGANDGATVETPNAEGADSTVYEAGLPTGSDVQPSDRDVASNSFTVSATDGIATVVIGGTLFTLAQLQAFNGTQAVNTGEGVLTLNSYGGDSFSGTVNYTYALSATIDNDSKPGASGTEFNDSVEITVNGVGGTTASDQLVIKIIDDVPSAVNDGPFGVKEDAAPNVVSGNVTGNDRSGADAPLEFVSWDGATGDDLSAYGTLVQNPTTGAWSFTLDNSLAATQALTATDVKTAVYSYTIKDADGDVDTATLTVTVTGANDGATVETPNAEGADSTVYEAGLPTGSDVQPSDRDVASNSFTVSATDGIATVVIGGTLFTLAQLQALNGTQTVNTGEGVLTLNSYSGDSFSGTVNYTYALSATIDNDSKPGASGTEFNDSVEITVNGVGGTTASDQLVIEIIDDVPSAVNDGPFGVKEDAAPNVVSGNVTGNDRSGADAPLEFVSWDGATGDDLSAYGTLVQNPTTGAWSFTLDNSLAATQALTATDVKTAVYSYTIKDADGDVDTATLTVTVTGANDGATVETPNAEGADSTVYEAGLPTGSDVQPSDRDVASNSFTVSATDGIATVVIGGTLFTLAQLQALNGTQTVNTGEGVLTLNSYSGDSFSGTVNYTYALSATIDNDSKPGASGTEFNDSVEITVNGVGGTTASDQLVIEIIDDVPSAVNDGPFGVKEDAAPNVVSGNVTGNDRSGADAPLEFVSWDGATGDDLSAYGTLVQNPTTGAWSFTLDNSLAATQALTATDVKTAVYSYTIKDADGDVDTATLTVTVTGANDGATVETPNAEGADSTVYEAGLPTGSDVQPSDRDVASNSFTVSATDGIATVVIGGTLFTLAQLQALNGTQTVNTGEGVLTLNSYSGDSFSGTVNYTYALSATIDNDSKPGASGTEFNDSVEITVNGVGGTTASDQLVIEIIDDVPSAVNDGPFGVKEDAAPNVVSGNVTGNDRSGADAPLEFVSWDGATGDDLSAYGTLVQNPTTGAWSFTLDNSLAATQALTATDVKTAVYSYTIKDADGDVDTATLTVRVTGANDGATVETPNAEGADSTVYEAGLPTGSDVQPSDRDVASNSFTVSATDGIATVVIGGTLFTLAQLQAFNGTQTVNTGEGVLTLNSYSGDSFSGTVNYTYALSATIDNDSKPGASGTEFNDSVEITVNGVGGTTASDQLVIEIIDDTPTVIANALVQLDDDALTGGNAGGTGDDADAVNVSGTLGHSFGADGAGTVAYLITGAPTGFTYELESTSLLIKQGTTTVLTLAVNESTGAYIVTQNNPIRHVAGLDENNQGFTVNYLVTDKDGDTAQGVLAIDVDDDTPTAFSPDPISLANPTRDASGNIIPSIKSAFLDASANLDDNVGADQSGTLAFIDISGGQLATAVIDSSGAPQNLTSGGQQIRLYLVDHDASGATPDRLEGRIGDASGALIYTVTLNPDLGDPSPSTDTYTVNVLAPIGVTSTTTITNFSAVKSGNSSFASLDISGTSQDLLFSAVAGTSVSTVNVSTTGLAVSNQSINDGETLRIDFVNNVDTGRTGGNDWYNYPSPANGHYTINNFEFAINQVNTPGGGGDTNSAIEVWVRIFDADDDDPASGGAGTTAAHAAELADDIQLNTIRQITVLKYDTASIPNLTATINYVADASGNLPGLVSDGSGGWLVPGLDLNDRVVVSAAGSGYDRIEIANAAGSGNLAGEAFDIGRLGYVTTSTRTPTIDLSYNVVLTDADGDRTPSAPLQIRLTAPVASQVASLLLDADPITGGPVLQQSELAPVKAAAIDFWRQQGLGDLALQGLEATDVLIGQLSGRMLGSTDGLSITLDDDAAGYGWSSSLTAVTPGDVDLYSALVHEYGHVLGYDHDLLGESLAPGERQLPLTLAAGSPLV